MLKLVQYVKEGHNALLYINRCHDTGHVPSAASLHSLEHTLIRVHKASNALQVIQLNRTLWALIVKRDTFGKYASCLCIHFVSFFLYVCVSLCYI